MQPVNDVPTKSEQPNRPRLVIYGFGGMGKRVVDQLLTAGYRIEAIIDKNKCGAFYKSIPVLSLNDLETRQVSSLECLIALHNHYVDVSQIYDALKPFDFRSIRTLAAIRTLCPDVAIDHGYWLDLNFDYDARKVEIEKFLSLLEDDKSRDIADRVLKYRKTGEISDCPVPSLFDEYIPADLPRYRAPLRLVDCGAYTGVAIEKFERAQYRIESVVAFEPDIDNFSRLKEKKFSIGQSIFLPLGTWSSNMQLRFSSSGDMASSLDAEGDRVIQCVRLDDVIPDFAPNLMKFDVEGAEIDTLMGAESIIKTFRPNLCISTYHLPDHFYRIGLLIDSWNLNYKFYFRVHEFNTFGCVLYCFQDDKVLT
jgi:FkbM family methyltransferase